MAYIEQQVFICNICGQQEMARANFRGEYILLPKGWKGSDRMAGDCYCSECYEAIEKVRKNKKKEN